MKIVKSALYCSVALASLALAAPSSAVVLSGTLNNSGGGTPGTIDFWSFTQNSAGTTSFDILSWEAFPTFADIQIWLFNGSVANANLVSSNDDSGGTFGDGSTNGLDSYMSLSLSAGSYIIAVATCCTNVGDITDNGTQASTSFYSPGFNDASTAQYRLTILGDVNLNLTAVPEPATALGSLGLILLGSTGIRYRRLSRKAS